MNERAEQSRFRWAIITALAFLACSFLAWTELRYAVLGRTARASVVDVSGSSVFYRFHDSHGRPGIGSADLPAGASVAVGDELRVRYVPPLFRRWPLAAALDDSRLAGSGNP